jgi:hypothetical protein
MMIAAMALFLLVILAPALQTYLNRRSTLAEAQRHGRELNSQISELQGQAKLWDDPAYVERQARERLQFIRPGDTLYTVLNADGTARDTTKAAIGVAPKAVEPLWSTKLWSSLVAADRAK